MPVSTRAQAKLQKANITHTSLPLARRRRNTTSPDEPLLADPSPNPALAPTDVGLTEHLHETSNETIITDDRSTSGALDVTKAKTSMAPPRIPTRPRHTVRPGKSRRKKMDDYPYVYHTTVEALRADPILPENWNHVHLTLARVNLVQNLVKPSPLPKELEDILKLSNRCESESILHKASTVEKYLAEGQQGLFDLTDDPNSITNQHHIMMSYFSICQAFFLTEGHEKDLELRAVGYKIYPWRPLDIIGTNLCRVLAISYEKPSLYEDSAYLLSFAQSTRCREPYMLAYHGIGQIRLLRAFIDDTYMAALMDGDVKGVENPLDVEVIGKWNLNTLEDRIQFAAMMADLARQLGIEEAEPNGDGKES